MSIESKYVALKEYIPMGNPSLSHFDLKSETISLKNANLSAKFDTLANRCM